MVCACARVAAYFMGSRHPVRKRRFCTYVCFRAFLAGGLCFCVWDPIIIMWCDLDFGVVRLLATYTFGLRSGSGNFRALFLGGLCFCVWDPFLLMRCDLDFSVVRFCVPLFGPFS